MRNSKLKIGILTPNYSETSGGGFTYITAITSAISKAELKEDYIVLSLDEILKNPLPDEGDVQTPKDHYPSVVLNRFLKAHHFDILWILSPLGAPIYSSIPFVMTVWDIAHRYYPFLPEISEGSWNIVEREHYYLSMLPRAALIITGNRRGVSELQQNYGVPIERLFVAPLPAPPLRPRTPSEHASPARRKRIFYPAQFWAHKNHVTAIRALSNLRIVFGSDAELVFCGADHGNEAYVKTLVQQLNLTDFVHFMGFIDRESIDNLFKESDVLLYLSLFGPDNLPPLEAFASDCPVVASDHPGHREQLGEAALLVDPLDPREIAFQLNKILTDQLLQKKLVAEGRSLAQSRTPIKYVTQVEAELQRIGKIRDLWSR